MPSQPHRPRPQRRRNRPPALNHTSTASATVAVRAPRETVRTVSPAGRRRRGDWVRWAFLAPLVVYLATFYAYPLYRNIDLSLRHYTVRSFVQGGAPFSGLDNYRAVFDDPTFV